ncbi:HNH endonuclease [Methanospirillum sp.]|uniref:HNH endonuclease n=1 Tax=Methanospirillum sp. TaxID=45200 RepID=UPI002D805EB9|nr:HNH endonuclease [Methanospirillum sp.]
MVDSDTISGPAGHPCLWCGNMTGSRKTYCSDICERRFLTWLETEPASVRGSRPPFWNLIRRQALERDGHQCQICGNTAELSVHHIVPLSEGGDSTLHNLRVLCHSCHQKEHGRHTSIVRKKKFRIRIRHQPMYIPATFFGDWIRQSGGEVYPS